MSASVDRQRAEDTRHEAVLRSRAHHAKLGRIIDLYAEGKTDREIAELLGWHEATVLRYRQVLLLALGGALHGRNAGRWYTKRAR